MQSIGHTCLVTVPTKANASNVRHKKLSPDCRSLPLHKDTLGVRSGVSPVAQPGSAQRASSFSCSTPAKTANPGPRHLRPERSSASQHFRTEAHRVLSSPGQLPRPEPDKQAAPSHPPPGVPVSPPRRAPLILEDAGSAARKATKSRARGRPCRHWMRGAFLSPRTPHHAPTPSSPPPPTTAHSRGSFARAAVLFPM